MCVKEVRMPGITFKNILLIASSFMLFACQPESLSRGFIGVTWVVEDIDHQGIIDSSHISFVFYEEGRVGGFAGCNNFNMPYEYQDGALTLGVAAATLKSCAPALLNQERKFFDVFSNVKTYSFDETQALVLQTEDDRSLTARQKGR